MMTAERGLVRQGVPKDKAKALGIAAAKIGAFRDPPTQSNLATVELPLRFTLPWTALISDNRKYAPATGSRGGKMILRQEYRDAKSKARALARDAVGGGLPIAKPLRMIVRVYVPDARPGHDVCNFAKGVHDALEGIVRPPIGTSSAEASSSMLIASKISRACAYMGSG